MTRFNELLQCSPVGLQYDFKTRVGTLYMVDGECCDMDGCIKLFSSIDKEVRQIKTVSGKKWDTFYSYIKRDKKWVALDGSVLS